MFGIKKDLTPDNILALISEEEIFRHYFGNEFKIGICYRSTLRGDDDTPSLNFYYNDNGRLRYKDFGHSQGSCFDYVKEKYNVSFHEALKIINHDFRLGLDGVAKGEPIRYQKFLKDFQKEYCNLQFSPRPYEEQDIAYWSDFGISKKTLDFFDVFVGNKLWKNGRLFWVYAKDNPMYIYYFKEEGKLKAYRPYGGKKRKWMMNAGEILQGLTKLPEEGGNLLIITKSYKDVFLWKEYGIHAVAPQGEGHYIKPKIIDYLWAKWDNIIVNYDNDDPGVKASIKLTNDIGAGYWNIPKSFGVKDITDFRKKYGKEEFEKLIKPFL